MSSVSSIDHLRQKKAHMQTKEKFMHNHIEDMHHAKSAVPQHPSKTLHKPNIDPSHFNEHVDLSGNVIGEGIEKLHVHHDRRMKHNPIDHALPNDNVHGNHIIYGGGFIIDKSKIL